MDKFLLLNTDSGTVLHHRFFSSKEDHMALGMQLTALIQLSQRSLRYLEAKELIVFSYSATAPLALVVYFPLHVITTDEAATMCAELLRAFATLLPDYTAGKRKPRVFQQLDEALEKALEMQFYATFKGFLREINKEAVEFGYLTIPGETAPQEHELKRAETSIVALGTPLTTDVSALARGSTPVPYSGKKKYPIRPEQAHVVRLISDFSRLLPVKTTPDERILATLESIGKLCGELMETCRDSWSHLRLVLESRVIIGLRSGAVTVFLVLSQEVTLTDAAWAGLDRIQTWALALKRTADKK